MKNNLSTLNNNLFEQLEKLQDDEYMAENFDKEITRADAVCKVSAQIIANSKICLDAQKHFDNMGVQNNGLINNLLGVSE